MLIRSQNKKILVNLDSIARFTVGEIYGKDKIGWLIEADKIPFIENIGVYSTEEKAIKVLDMIEQAYRSCVYTDCAYDYSAKVERPYIFAKNRVFQMPADEEVEV